MLSLGHWLRARAVFDPPFVTLILGVLPNVAAAVAIPFVAAGALADMRKDRQVPVSRTVFTILNAGSVVGLGGWELVQRTSATLRFDVADLVATLVGGLIAQGLFARMWHHPSRTR
ncbi:MAG: hypothetical protein IT181_10450 [Acidobacteria bacterium]|nr:hypothetical protein [Acidobacteriota bacterium]